MKTEIIEKKLLYSGNIFDLQKYTVRLPDGKEAHRDVIKHNGAVAIIPVTDDGQLVLVRQYRPGVDGLLLEFPAGKLDPGEEPETCALRELAEETGYRATKISRLLKMHPVAAYCTEEITLFLATKLKAGEPSPDEGEFVEVEIHPPSTLLRMVDEGKITDMKTILALLYYVRMEASDN